MDTADIITSSIAALALIVSGWSAWYARSSAAAAKRSAVAAERQAAAAEAALPPAPPSVAWVIRRDMRRQFLLRNVGTDVVTGLERVFTGQDSDGLVRFPSTARVLPGGEVAFLVLETMQLAAPRELLLRWDGQSEPVAVPIPQ